MSQAIRCVILRGGTSKGVYLLENDLPQDAAERDRVILRIFGSPDARQINGLGGADPLTSKVAVVAPSRRPDADIEYTFGQVAIDHAKVYYKSLCGNITSGVGPFAINMGLVKAVEPVTIVRMYNRNTGKILIAETPVRDGRFLEEGDYAIAGVPGTGARINVDFSGTAGALTGKFLPTGRVRDRVEVEGWGDLEISIVDAATCQIFVRAADAGLAGTEMPADVDKNPELLARLEAIRSQGAYLAGLISDPAAGAESRNTPHLVLVSPARAYVTHLEQKQIAAADIDFTVRMMFMQIMHKTYAGTGSVCTAIASLTPGTIAHEFNRRNTGKIQTVRLGHPGGVIEVEAGLTEENGGYKVTRAAIGRTARQIMTGQVFV
ncbi:MAG: 3-methylitaconate isomerase [Gracilibacteraceae bacterium]|jgi:2-methylaconitate cis-trans-isomerase PrpF|nr:3-methylitaconate isomerase [Gracilibacteraceae bacterium]